MQVFERRSNYFRRIFVVLQYGGGKTGGGEEGKGSHGFYGFDGRMMGKNRQQREPR